MPQIPDLIGRIRLDTRDLDRAEGKIRAFGASTGSSLGNLDRSLGRVEKSIKNAGNGLADFGKRASLSATLPIVGALGLATKAAVDFDRQMQNVNSITGASADELAATSDKVIEISKRLPQSASVLAAGLYDISSSGFAGADGLKVLESAAAAASAGLTDTATSSKGITAVLNAYGLAAEDSGRISDVLFQTVNKGVVTFEELAASLGDFVGTASQAGVSIEEASAALATMTLSGISGAEAATSLNQVFRALIDPSDAMAAKLSELGLGLNSLKDPAIGLQGVMEALRKATGGNIAELVKLFPEIRGARGALALMADDGNKAKEVFASFKDETKLLGATQRALEEQSKSAAFQFDILRNRMEAVAIEVGNKLIPHLLGLAGVVADVASGFGSLPDGAQSVALIGLAAVAAVGPVTYLAGNVLKLKAALNALTAVAATSSLATGALTAAAIKLGARLTLIGTGLLVAKQAADSARPSMAKLGEEMDRKRGNWLDRLLNAIPLGHSFPDAANAARKSVSELGSSLPAVVAEVDRVKSVSDSTGNALIGVADAADVATVSHKDAAKAAKAQADALRDILAASEDLIPRQLSVADGMSELVSKQDEAREKEQALAEAIKAHGRGSHEAQVAFRELDEARRGEIRSIDDLAKAQRDFAAQQAAAAGRQLTDAESYRIYRDELIKLKDALAPESPLRVNMEGLINQLPPPEVKFKVIADIEAAIKNLDMIRRAQDLLGISLPFVGKLGVKRHQGGPIGLMGGSVREVPALLQTGEYVINRAAAARLGLPTLNRLNRYHDGGPVPQLVGAAAATAGVNITVPVRTNATGDEIARAIAWGMR